MLNFIRSRWINFLTLWLIILSLNVQAALEPWWSPERSYRISVTVSANGYLRKDKPAEVSLNFTTVLANSGVSGTLDSNSLVVVEYDNTGVVNDNVPFQFDQDGNFDAASNASGTLVLWVGGTTAANASRTFHVYFDVAGKSFTAPAFNDKVAVTTADDEGQSSFQVQTDNATYFYQKDAGGFSSILDVNNNDWLNYHPLPANSPSSSYRGIPNMVHPEGKLHPGATGHVSTLIKSGPLKETIRTVIDADSDPSHKWDVTWEIFPSYARMTVNDFEHNYWFLYEGTPGGDLEPGLDFVVRSTGSTNLAANSWTNDIPGEEWVYFADPGVNRSLFLISHAEDALVDSYRAMGDSNGDMTVFGFGRNGQTKLLNQAPASFTIGLMDTTTFASAAPIVRGTYKPLAINVGTLELATIVGDQVPPVINNVVATGITTTQATINWSTDENSTSVVNYDLTTNYGQTAIDSVQVQNHGIQLTGLTANTTYHFRVKSTDASGNTAISADFTFTTLASAGGGSASGLVSDGFNSALDTNLWSFSDPAGNSTWSTTGSEVSISVPAGTNHDLWTGKLNAPRLRQVANNTDFEVEVKYNSAVNSKYQLNGLIVEQDPTNLLRADFHFDGAVTKIFSATFVNGAPTTRFSTTVTNGAPKYLKLRRQGSQWTISHSADGSNWTVAGSYNHAMTVSSVGIFAGNSGTTMPAYTSVVDYFRVDGIEPGSSDVTPPVISNVQATQIANNSSTITWTTNEASNTLVNYGPTALYDSAAGNASNVKNHSITVTGLDPALTYHYRVNSTDPSGNASSSIDLIIPKDPQNLLVFDWNAVVTKSHHGVPANKPPLASANGDWTTPINYVQGTLYLRAEIRSQQVPKSMKLQFCIWQYNSTLEECVPLSVTPLMIGNPGTIATWSTPMPQLWKKNGVPVDWKNPRGQYGVVIKRSPDFLTVSDYNGWNWYGENPDEWFPIDMRFTVVAVPQGGTFLGWDKFIK